MWYWWIFHKKLCDQRPQKSDPIDYNGEHNLVVCQICQDLVYLLQGVDVNASEFMGYWE